MTNPPLDFQQNPVEFVMDALRVARAAYDKRASGHLSERENLKVLAEYRATFLPPTVIAILEDWLRLQTLVERIVKKIEYVGAHESLTEETCLKEIDTEARAALAKQG